MTLQKILTQTATGMRLIVPEQLAQRVQRVQLVLLV